MIVREWKLWYFSRQNIWEKELWCSQLFFWYHGCNRSFNVVAAKKKNMCLLFLCTHETCIPLLFRIASSVYYYHFLPLPLTCAFNVGRGEERKKKGRREHQPTSFLVLLSAAFSFPPPSSFWETCRSPSKCPAWERYQNCVCTHGGRLRGIAEKSPTPRCKCIFWYCIPAGGTYLRPVVVLVVVVVVEDLGNTCT